MISSKWLFSQGYNSKNVNSGIFALQTIIISSEFYTAQKMQTRNKKILYFKRNMIFDISTIW